MASVAIGVDIGGTFTDVVCVDDEGGEIHFTKVGTNYTDIIAGVIEGLTKILAVVGATPSEIARIAHGTTVATNVVVQRKGATTSLFTTVGFEDVLEIGRLKRRSMYDLDIDVQTPVFLSPRRLRVGVPERLDPAGKVLRGLDEDFVARTVTDLRARHDIQSVAVVYLYSFRNNVHELRTRDIIKDLFPEIFVSLSSEVNPIYREFERTVVTAFDAYMRPTVESFMANLEARLRDFGLDAEVHVMQSRGGVTSTRIAGQRPVNLFLSGPAGGVVGAAQLSQRVGYADVVTIDIGGTSCDVALISGGVPSVNTTGEIAEYAVPVSMVGVNTIGAGGGSILWTDAAGMLRVGPHSAGSDPGPACYARGGTEPTITDASVVLSYLDPEAFAGGEIPLDRDRAAGAVGKIADRMGMSLVDAALGAHRIMNVQMAEQVRLITIKRGHDPRQFTLMAFGGAGPLHAGALTSMLGMKQSLIPQTPGVLSAFGLLSADVEVEQQTTFLVRADEADSQDIARILGALRELCVQIMRDDGFNVDGVRVRYSADLRYVGQSYEISLALRDEDIGPNTVRHLVEDFEEQYMRLYGFSNRTEVEIVNLRAVTYNPVMMPQGLRLHRAGDGGDALRYQSAVWFLGSEQPIETRFYEREGLRPGDRISGPAIIGQADTTTVVYPQQAAVVDPHQNMIIGGVAEAYTL